MHFLTPAVLLPALAMATTYRGVGKDQSPLANSPLDANAGNAPGENECGVSSFKDTHSGQAPSVEDCRAMLDTIRADQEWTVYPTPASIVAHGSCSFIVQTRGGEAEIGNADVIDLVTDSIANFEKQGAVSCKGGFPLYVSAKGTVPCEELRDDRKKVIVDWSIVNSGVSPGLQGTMKKIRNVFRA